jgi:hypothetical protein
VEIGLKLRSRGHVRRVFQGSEYGVPGVVDEDVDAAVDGLGLGEGGGEVGRCYV